MVRLLNVLATLSTAAISNVITNVFNMQLIYSDGKIVTCEH